MATPTRRPAARIAMIALAGFLLAIPSGVAANSSNPITQTGGMSASLPLLGTTLTVDVALDGVGNISGVTLNPSTTLSSTSTAKDVVKFSNADGSVKVSVKASGDRMAIKAKSTLDNLLGKGTWSANVFGTGSAAVDYTIAKDADGKPTVSIGDITAPSGVVATKLDPTAKTGSRSSKKSDDWAWAFAGVSFSHDGFTKRLSISISAELPDGPAKLAIVLSGRDRQKLTGTLEELAGPRTWSAKLCDGTAVAVDYHVAADGTVVYDGATGATAKERDLKAGDGGHKAKDGGKHFGRKNLVSGIVVRFDKTNVGVAVWLVKNDDGTYTLKVAGSSGHCGDGKGHRHHHHGDGNGNGNGDRRGDHRGDGRHGNGHHGNGHH
ncbi:MAG: hypothetical protein QOF11_2163 [Chloroflexota bacterium]|nr:hypothetical protein [Chloroflexota bacterium]